MEKELKDQRVTIMLTPSELKAVDDWSFAHRIRSRGEAIRQLIDVGLTIPELAAELSFNVSSDISNDHPEVVATASALMSALKRHYEKIQEINKKNVVEHAWIERLTKNERVVHDALSNGATANDIAKMLGISESTANWYITGIASLRRA